MNKITFQIIAFFISGFILVSCGGEKVQNESGGDEKTDQTLSVLDDLNKQIQGDPDNPDLYNKRARFYLENKDYNSALKDIVSALEIDSTYTAYHVTLADIYLETGKLQKTVASLEKAIDLDSQNTDAYIKLAEISIVIRDYKKAIGYIDLALQVDELIEKAYMLRGVIMLENGDTLRGIRNFQRAIDVNQKYLEAHLQLGMLYADKKNDLAIDYFNNALNIDPENIDAIYYLAMYYQETEKYDRAIQTYNSILTKVPEFYIACYNIGYINLVFLEELETAIEYFTQTIDINPDYAEAYYNRGFAYELLKNVENSKKDYEKTLELHTNYDKAIAGLNRIEEYLESGGRSTILLRKSANEEDN